MKLTVNLEKDSYPIYIENNILIPGRRLHPKDLPRKTHYDHFR